MFALLQQEEDPKIAARRARDEARRARILDPAQYANGAKRDELEAQIAEKKAAEAAVRAAGAQDATTLKEIDRFTLEVAKREHEDRLAATKATADFRLTHQRKELSDTFALNDPNELKNTTMNEDELGPSSLQVFAGEDRDFADRKKSQMEQTRLWAATATQEKQTHQRELEEKIFAEEDALAKQYQMTMALDLQNQQELKQSREMFAQTNLEMAAEQRRIRRAQEQQEQEDTLRHMVTQVEALKEDPSQAVGRDGKILTDRFKGFSADQLAEIRQVQAEQAKEQTARRSESAAKDAKYGDDLRSQAKAVYLLERQAQRQKMAMVQNQVEENKRMALEKAARNAPVKNEIDSSFFAQFQTSCR